MRPWTLAALLLAGAACGTGTDGRPVTPPTAPEPEPPPLTAPTGLQVAEVRTERGYTWITWTWDPVPGVGEYLVGFRFDDQEHEFGELVTEPSFTSPDGLTYGRVMHVRVRVLQERVAGPWSEPVTGRADTKPPVPPGLFQDPRFDRDFWRELVFNARDCPTDAAWCDDPPVEERLVWTLRDPSPNFYIRTHDDRGNLAFDSTDIAVMRSVIPRAVSDLSGQPYTGEIRESPEAFVATAGWVLIQDSEPLDSGGCGFASVGASPGRIGIVGDDGPEGCDLRSLMVHEIGHVMGFWHVSDQCDAMFSGGSCNPSWFSARERFHARLAYELGRGHSYVDDRTETMTTTTALPMPEPVVVSCPGPMH